MPPRVHEARADAAVVQRGDGVTAERGDGRERAAAEHALGEASPGQAGDVGLVGEQAHELDAGEAPRPLDEGRDVGAGAQRAAAHAEVCALAEVERDVEVDHRARPRQLLDGLEVLDGVDDEEAVLVLGGAREARQGRAVERGVRDEHVALRLRQGLQQPRRLVVVERQDAAEDRIVIEHAGEQPERADRLAAHAHGLARASRGLRDALDVAIEGVEIDDQRGQALVLQRGADGIPVEHRQQDSRSSILTEATT